MSDLWTLSGGRVRPSFVTLGQDMEGRVRAFTDGRCIWPEEVLGLTQAHIDAAWARGYRHLAVLSEATWHPR